MVWFSDSNEVEEFIRKNKPPTGKRWEVYEDEGFVDEFSYEHSLSVKGGYYITCVKDTEFIPISAPHIQSAEDRKRFIQENTDPDDPDGLDKAREKWRKTYLSDTPDVDDTNYGGWMGPHGGNH